MAGLSTAQQVTQTVAQAIRNRDGPRLADALRLDLGNTSLMTQLASGSVQLDHLCGTALEEPYDEMLLEHFEFLRAVHRDEQSEAYAHQERASTCLRQLFGASGSSPSSSSRPSLYVGFHDAPQE